MPSVLAVYETFDERSMRAATDRTRDYVRTFNVIVSHREISPDLILFAAGVPRRWEPYISAAGTVDAYSICKDVEVKQDNQDPYLFRVKAQYSNSVQRPDLNLIENPLLRPADVEWDTVMVPHPAWVDRAKKPIMNSAEERFDPPLEYEEGRLQLTVTRNQAGYDALGYLKFVNTVNSKKWFGLQPGRVKCCSIKGKRQFESGVFFWPTTYVFQIRVQLDEGDNPADPAASKNAWAHRVADRGYMELAYGAYIDPANGELVEEYWPVHMRDLRTGQALASPALLNGFGSRLRTGALPKFLTFHLFPERDFRRLLPF